MNFLRLSRIGERIIQRPLNESLWVSCHDKFKIKAMSPSVHILHHQFKLLIGLNIPKYLKKYLDYHWPFYFFYQDDTLFYKLLQPDKLSFRSHYWVFESIKPVLWLIAARCQVSSMPILMSEESALAAT